MELEFRQVQIPYLHCISYETLIQEAHGEAIVPDTMPDMERVAGCCADAVLREKQLGDGTLTLSGDVQTCVLYQADGQTGQLSLSLPFSLRRPAPGDGCRCAVQCRVQSAEARMVNSRKAGVRVGLILTVQIWCAREQTCFAPADTDRRVQLKFETFPMVLTKECVEKNVLLRDALRPDTELPEGARIVYTGADCEITDEKLSGSQAVCKGNLRLRLLCQDPEGDLIGCELSLPFSQLIDLEGSYDEQDVQIVPVLTAAEAAAENGGVTAEAGLCLQCIVTQTVNVPVVEDAYALRGSLQTETRGLRLQPLLDRRILRQDVTMALPARAASVLCTEVLPDVPQIEWQDSTCRIRAPVTVRVLYRDDQGQCRQVEGRGELRQELNAGPSLCRAEAAPNGQMYASPGTDRIEVRVPMEVHARWYDDDARECVCAASVGDAPREERPAVIVRTLEADVPLWDLAKELRTTVSAIQIANDMDEDVAPAGMILLIPIVA